MINRKYEEKKKVFILPVKEMKRLNVKHYDPDIFKKALGNLLKLKNYHVAAPTQKTKMLKREYSRILNSEKTERISDGN